ncbi:hypothetical protein QFC22_006387 [Naganishia vaughanmartiniae]|uniref:Uncharacterized protein n=1 Tax=Naganishia vaughanmartiniae TaxID=1424756 RepID=A0ACC2WK21_9TREE|nr:hypothetical protein QFC22_006387 [Naganishia vaughanmartiniae]
MGVSVSMSIDARRLTQSGLRQAVAGSPNSSGTSSTPSVTYTSAIAIANSPETKRLSRLLSFVVALNNRDYTSSCIDPKGEGADTPTVSGLILAADASSLECTVAQSDVVEIQGSVA